MAPRKKKTTKKTATTKKRQPKGALTDRKAPEDFTGPLDERQRAFCAQYIIDFNATRSAKDSGYSARSARSIGAQLLQRLNIQQEIQNLMNRRAAVVDLKQEDVVRELMLIGFNDINNFDIDPDTGQVTAAEGAPDGVTRTISAIEFNQSYDREGNHLGTKTKVKFWSKDRALENLGKHLSLFIERREISGPDGKPIEMRNGLSEEAAEFLRKKILGLVE